jgi:hypothetical protein
LGLISVHDVYENISLYKDFTLAGQPQFNPVESAFRYIKSVVKNDSKDYDLTHGWKKEDLEKVLIKAINSITFNMVQRYYIRTYKLLYPLMKIPTFLHSDLLKTIFDW